MIVEVLIVVVGLVDALGVGVGVVFVPCELLSIAVVVAGYSQCFPVVSDGQWQPQ